jgi:capsular exopolysaccharide synthesis family protein
MKGTENFLEKMVLEVKKKIRAFQRKLLRNWYWFVLFAGLGVTAAYAYSYYAPAEYQAKSTILVQSESNVLKGKDFFDENAGKKGINIQDHIGVLKSRSLSMQVLKSLGWETSWYTRQLFDEVDLYGQEPFILIENLVVDNPKNVPLNVIMLSDTEYSVGFEGNEQLPAFSEKVRFGELFDNGHFSFVLEKNPEVIVQQNIAFKLILNDFASMALNYSGKLEVSLDDLKGKIIALKLTGSHKQRVVDFINELSKEYIKYNLKEKNRVSENTVRFIDMQLDGVADSLHNAGNLYSNFQSQNKSLDIQQDANLIRSDVKKLEEEYALAERKLNHYKNINDYLRKSEHFKRVEGNLSNDFGSDKSGSTVVVPAVMDIADPVMNSLVMKLGELTSKKEVLSFSVKDNDPNMLVLEKEIKYTKQSLKENLTNLLIRAQGDLNSISRRLNAKKSMITVLPEMEQKFTDIKRRYDLNNDLYNFLLKKRAEAEITIASNVPNSQILDQASVLATSKVAPKTFFNLIAGFMVGIMIPFFYLKLRSYLNNRIESLHEIERESNIPLMGIISHNKNKKELIVSKRPRAAITETFRSLRTDLENQLEDGEQHVISVQSFMPGEGKSFVSVNLAAILALNHRKVLLVETDMRKPKLSKLFGCDGTSGMSSYLEEEENFNDIVCPTQIENLSFIPAGPLPENPAELLANGKFKRFMETVRRKYNYIVMDSAPTSVVTDGILTGKYADVNLFVLRHRYSKKGQMKYINKLVDKGSLKNVSLVVNDFKPNGTDPIKIGYKNGYYEDNYITNALK